MAWLHKQQRNNRKVGKKETYFSIKWRDETGKTRTRAVGFSSRSEAKKMLKVFEGRLAAGEPVEPPTPTAVGSSGKKQKTPALRDYVENVYLPVVRRDKSKATADSADYSSRSLLAAMGDLEISRVNFAVVDAYLNERREQGRKPSTLRLEMWCLRGALRHAVDCQVIPEVPKLPSIRIVDQPNRKFLRDDETVALLNALRPLDKQPHKVTRGRPPIRRDRLTYLAVLVALNTGARKGEILTRRWEDVRWNQGERGALHIGPQDAISFQVKTRRSRTIPLTPELRDELTAEHKRVGGPQSGWIFPSPVDPNKPRKSFGKALIQACKRADLQRIHPHSLRHTWASRLAMAGVDRRTLLELGGWSEGRMLDDIYAHVTDSHMDEVMGRMGITAGQGRPQKAPEPSRHRED